MTKNKTQYFQFRQNNSGGSGRQLGVLLMSLFKKAKSVPEVTADVLKEHIPSYGYYCHVEPTADGWWTVTLYRDTETGARSNVVIAQDIGGSNRNWDQWRKTVKNLPDATDLAKKYIEEANQKHHAKHGRKAFTVRTDR